MSHVYNGDGQQGRPAGERSSLIVRHSWFACPVWIGVTGLLKLVPGNKPWQQNLYTSEIVFLTLMYGWFLYSRWRRLRRPPVTLESVFDRVWPEIPEDLREEYRQGGGI